jgi:WD40 repeat protein
MAKGDDYIQQLWERVVDPKLKGDWIGAIFMRWNSLKKGPFWRTGPALRDLLAQGASRKDLAKLAAFARLETCFNFLVALDDPGLGTAKIRGIHKEFLKSGPNSIARNQREEFFQWLWETEEFTDDNGRWLKDLTQKDLQIKPFRNLYSTVKRVLEKIKKPRDVGIFLGWNKHEACAMALRLLEVAGFERGDEPVCLHEEFDTGYPGNRIKKRKTTPDGQPDPTEPLWHIKSAQALAFSPDSKTLAVAGASSPIRLYDLATGEEMLACEGTRVHIYEIVFSPDGKQVTAGQIRKEISVCDVKTGKLLHKLYAKTKGIGILEQEISGLEFTRAGELIRSGWQGEIEIFDSKTGKTLPALKVNDNTDKVDAISVFRKGTRLAVLCEDNLSIWSWPERKLLLQFKAGGWLARVAATPDGKTLAVSDGDKGVTFFDATSGKQRSFIKGKDFKKLVFTPDGSHLIIDRYNADEISIWNLYRKKEIRKLPVKEGAFALDVSADGEYLGAATGRGAFVWRLPPLLAAK